MGFFDRIARGLNDRAPVQRRAARPALPAAPDGALVPVPFGVDTLTKQRDSVADLATVIALYRVPKDTVLTVQRAKPFRMYLGAVYEHTFTPNMDTFVTVTLPNGFVTTDRGGSFPDTGTHPDVRAEISNDGVTFTDAVVQSINEAAGTVTVTTIGTTKVARIHYLPVKGEVEVRVIRPNGGAVDMASRQWNASLLTLAATDQASGETALKFSGLTPTFSLPPEWSLGVVVRGPDTIDWDSPLTEFYADVYAQRLTVYDQAALYAFAEQSLRG